MRGVDPVSTTATTAPAPVGDRVRLVGVDHVEPPLVGAQRIARRGRGPRGGQRARQQARDQPSQEAPHGSQCKKPGPPASRQPGRSRPRTNLVRCLSRLAISRYHRLGMRDYLEAIHSRVVVFDGGMGATLEQFDLTPEDYGGLPGKCHEALVLNRPDVIQGVHESMIEAGAEVLETDTFQASRLKLERVGPRRPHARDQPQGRPDRPQGRRRAQLRGRLDRPDRLPARLRRPHARQDHVRRAGGGVHRAGAAASSRAAPT